MIRKIGLLVCGLIFIFAMTACEVKEPEKAEAPTPAVSEKEGGTLVFGRGGDSVGLDPAYETDGNSFMICDGSRPRKCLCSCLKRTVGANSPSSCAR